MKRILQHTLIAASLLIGSGLAASADTTTYFFKDMLRPGGQERADMEKYRDATACGSHGDSDVPADLAAFKRCMRVHGWRFDHVATERSPEQGPLTCLARVVDIEDTGIGLNHHSLARMTLHVTPPHGRAFDTTITRAVSNHNPPYRGGTMHVTCDPANPEDIHPVD
jgi:hypothetical protein